MKWKKYWTKPLRLVALVWLFTLAVALPAFGSETIKGIKAIGRRVALWCE